MNKKLLTAVIIVILILIGIAGYLVSQNKKSVTTSNTPSVEPSQQAPTVVAPDFMKALQGSGSVKCTYVYEGVTGTTYIKNGKVRFEGTTQGVTNNSLMIDKIVYTWANGAKTGYMIDTAAISASVTPQQGQNYQSLDKIKSDLTNYKPQCSNEPIADSMFEKPTGVTFQDMSKIMNEFKSKIPANVSIPQGYKVPAQ